MNNRGEVVTALIVIGVVALAIGGLFLVKGDITGKITGFATRGIMAAAVDFVLPTPTGNTSADYIYVNVSTSTSDEHYTFVDFDGDLVGFWRMEDRNASYVEDESGNGLHGSIENGSTFASGKYNDTFEGDGIDNYIHVDDDSAFDAIADNDEMTVCAWTYRVGDSNAHGTNQGVLGQYWATGPHDYDNKSFAIAEQITAPNGGYGFFVSANGAAWQDAHSDSSVAANEWHHLCGVVESGGTVKLYIDGVVQSDTGSVTGIYNPADTPFTIGTYFYAPAGNDNDSTLFFNGSVDEVILLSRGLSQSEIRAIYNSSQYAEFANNYTSLSNDTGHTFTAYAVETDGEINSTSRTIYTEVEEDNDTTDPEIDFASPTETSGENLSRNYIQVNVTASDDNLANITVYLYNSTSLVDSDTGTSSPHFVNFTGLSNETYYFNATALDDSSNDNSTETRNVTIAYAAPEPSNESSLNISFVSPTPTEDTNDTYMYVNVSTESNLEHYSFVDFNDDLVGWWRLENTSFIDSSGNGNDGSAVNSSDVTSTKYGNGLQGDGYGKYVTIDDSSSFDSIATNDEMTVCSWVYPYSNDNSHGAAQAVLGQWQSDGNDKSFAFLEGLAGQGIYAFYVSGGGSAWEDAQADSALTLNTWAHLCGTSDGTTVKLYVDGVLQSDTGTMSGIYNADINFTIGTYNIGSSLFYNGSVDEVLLFNRELSLSEIRAIYNSSAYASFANNYTSLSNGSYTFIGYGVDINSSVNSTSRTIQTGAVSLTVPEITLVSETTQENTFQVVLNTDVAASTCYFTDDNGSTYTTMLENSTTSFYYEDFDYGEYDITFYCQNENGTGDLTDSFEFRRSLVETDSHYTNSHGLDIYFDFGFNTTNETGRTVIIPDSWSALKDATWVLNSENYFMSKGYVAVPVNTRGKGLSEGSKDAFGYECLDIHELAEYLRTTSPYSHYVNGVVYVAGASGAGGKVGVCTAKCPDAYAAGYSSVGVLNLSLWWQTAGAGDVSEMENRVGCGYDECPYRYDARDASLLNYNTQSAVKLWHPINDDRVTVNCSRDYNRTMNENNKTVNYTEPATGGHSAYFIGSHEWFLNYTEEPIIPENGTFRIGVYVHSKNFTIDLNNNSYYAEVDYDISDAVKHFNLTTYEFNGSASFEVNDLIASTNYSVTINDSSSYYDSDSNGDLEFNATLDNNSYYEISVGPAGAYCGDGSCNNGETCSTCPADCGSCDTGGGGGGRGGSSTTIVENVTSNITGVHAMSSSAINDLVSKEGDIKTIVWKVKNTGTLFLNDCILEARGNVSNWLNVGERHQLAAGEEYDFVFKINIPEDVAPEVYSAGVELVCKELTERQDFSIEITKEELGFELVRVERIGDNEILVTYSLTEVSGLDQEVKLQFVIFDAENNKVLEATDIRNIKAGTEQEYGLQIQVDKGLKGNLNLLVNINSETYSSLVQEDIFLAPMSGFSIFGDSFGNEDWIMGGALAFVLGIIIFFVVRSIMKARQ